MSKVRTLISAEIDRLKALKQSVQDQIEQTRTLLDTQKATLASINKDLDDFRDAFKQQGSDA